MKKGLKQIGLNCKHYGELATVYREIERIFEELMQTKFATYKVNTTL
jgi:hypothetical protein